MKFIGLSLKYMFKNFLYIFLLCLVPAVFIGLLLNPFKIFSFMANYSKITVNSYGSIFNALFDFNIVSLILLVVGIVLISVCASMVLGAMENHLRSGKLNYKNLTSYINNNLMVIMLNLFAMIVIYFLLICLLSAILLLFHLMFSGIGNTPTVFNTIFSVIFCAGVFALFVQVMAIGFVNIPNMIINGDPFRQATANSVNQLNKKNFWFLLAIVIPFLVIIPLICIIPAGWLWTINILGTLFVLMYYCSLTMTGYFEICDIMRYDNRKYYYSYK